MRRLPTPLRALAILALVIVGASSCKRSGAETSQAPASAPPVKVESATIEQRPMPHLLTLTGALVANQQSELAADATGKVIATEVERGSIVKKGQVILRLDARNASLSERETAALAQAAASQRKLADEECERSKKLLQSGSISQAEFDRTSAQCAQSSSSAIAADTRRQMAMKSMGDSFIRAPYAGLIAERYVSVGEFVLPQTKVAVLLEIDPLRLQLTVAEAAIPLIKLDQHVDFSVASYPDQSFGGSIRYLGPALRGNSRDLLVEALVKNEDHRLHPGMFVTARVSLGDQTLPVVPADSIRTDGAIHRVFLVVDQQIEERVVQIGEARDGVVAIADGVKTGERIVLHPAESLSDGQRVE